VDEPGVVAVVLAAVVIWGAFSSRLERADLTAPIVFVALGGVLGGFDIGDLGGLPELAGEVRLLAELTLVLVLFSDAARVRFAELRGDAGVYVRLLVVALPLAMLFGTGLAAVLFTGPLDIWLLVLVGAALAPTDAALGTLVVTNPAVPSRIRRALNVESGLNDGLATPVVLAAIAGFAAVEEVAGATGVAQVLISLALGLLVGLVVGGAGGWLIRVAERRGWIDENFGGPAILALALLGYAVALLLDGNGFVAAFVSGLAFRNACGRQSKREVAYTEQSGGALSLVVWLLFGAVVLPVTVENLDWRVVVFAVLSLTVARMLAVALAMIGGGFRPVTVAFLGWFGPRGLASVIFALLAVEELGSAASEAVAFIGATVLLSVVAHGASAKPLANRYGAAVARPAEARPMPELPVRRLSIGHHSRSPRASRGARD
jgi:NhaP-type Na+/H+ or K+/H+ antiporter